MAEQRCLLFGFKLLPLLWCGYTLSYLQILNESHTYDSSVLVIFQQVKWGRVCSCMG